ncbi:MAG: hypothetical protein MJ002_08360 [Paludibacteraceae bacterium]|nr:hypothetical protein [Paludibacteraceae bacterium]
MVYHSERRKLPNRQQKDSPTRQQERNTMNETQESSLRFLLDQLHIRHSAATITEATTLLYPTYNEP